MLARDKKKKKKKKKNLENVYEEEKDNKIFNVTKTSLCQTTKDVCCEKKRLFGNDHIMLRDNSARNRIWEVFFIYLSRSPSTLPDSGGMGS